MLKKIIKLFYKVYKFRDRKSKKRGRPKTYSDKEIIVILLIMEVKKIHTLFGIVRFLNNNKNLLKLIGITTSPSRKTIRKRNKKLSSKLRYIIRKIGKDLAVHFGIDFKIASTDTTMFKSAGPLWHKKDRKLNSIPRKLRNVDKESKWGYSPTKGWIQGYKGHITIMFDLDRKVPFFPIDAVLTTANKSDFTKMKTITNDLPDTILFVLEDRGYEDENDFNRLLKKGVCKITPIKNTKRKNVSRTCRESLYTLCRSIYKYRKETIEPFNNVLKSNFNLDPMPRIGKNMANIYFYMSLIAYQLIVIYNIRTKRKIGSVKEVLDLM